MSREGADTKRRWLIQPLLLVLVVYFYIVLEWLFFFTKPSFLSRLAAAASLRVLLVTPAPFAIAAVVLMALIRLPVLVSRNRAVERVSDAAGMIVTAGALAAALLLLVDNFTYTVLRFGVRTTEGAEKLAYVVLLLVLVAVSFQVLSELGAKLRRSARRGTVTTAVSCLVLVTLVLMLVTIDYSGIDALEADDNVELRHRPNFVLISVDGLNADHLPLYGYERDTTPFLTSIAGDALICENNFVNADASSGSIVSLLTGKLPMQTGVVFVPDILRGKDAYQHLPGILRRHGYRTVDISIRSHADPVDLNMRNAFTWANFREIRENRTADLLTLLLGGQSYYFIKKMRARIFDRLSHMFAVRTMEDPLGEVLLRKRRFNRDDERIKTLLPFFHNPPAPFFVHVHLMGTHGPKFQPLERSFSAGEEQTDPWMSDFYDDAILNFDSQLRTIMKTLRKDRVSNNTVVIVCTDHGQGWVSDIRTPLILLFPYGEHSGRITANTQNLDIAPTILDYLGLERPEWMGGRSLLSTTIDDDRFILAAGRKHYTLRKTMRGWEAEQSEIRAPFYSLGEVYAFYHHMMYRLDLFQCTVAVSDIEGHTSPCPESDLPDPREVGRMIVDRLDSWGYDVSSLNTPLTTVAGEERDVRAARDPGEE